MVFICQELGVFSIIFTFFAKKIIVYENFLIIFRGFLIYPLDGYHTPWYIPLKEDKTLVKFENNTNLYKPVQAKSINCVLD